MSSIEELLQKKPKTNKDFTFKVKIKKRATKDYVEKIEKLKVQRKYSNDRPQSNSPRPFSKEGNNESTLQIKQTGRIIDLTNKGFDREKFIIRSTTIYEAKTSLKTA